MFSAAIAELLEFDPVRIISTIFLSGVITLLAYCASQVDHHTNIFLWHMLSNPFGSIGAVCDSPLLQINAAQLIHYFGDDTGPDRQATFANGELRAFFQRHSRD